MADAIAYHVIEIRIPIPAGSRVKQAPVIAKYEKELIALENKLPEGSEFSDKVIEPRANSGAERKPRETMEQKVAKGVAEELAKRTAAGGLREAAE